MMGSRKKLSKGREKGKSRKGKRDHLIKYLDDCDEAAVPAGAAKEAMTQDWDKNLRKDAIAVVRRRYHLGRVWSPQVKAAGHGGKRQLQERIGDAHNRKRRWVADSITVADRIDLLRADPKWAEALPISLGHGSWDRLSKALVNIIERGDPNKGPEPAMPTVREKINAIRRRRGGLLDAIEQLGEPSLSTQEFRTLAFLASQRVGEQRSVAVELRDPTSLEGVVGNEQAKSVLRGLLGRSGPAPVILVIGPTGSGKTQLAKIFTLHWHSMYAEDPIDPKPYQLVGCGDDRNQAVKAMESWFGSVIDDAAIIMNEVEELQVDQRRLLSLLEGARGELRAPVILTTTRTRTDTCRVNKGILALDPQLVRRATVVIETEVVSDAEMKQYVVKLAGAEGGRVPDDDIVRIVRDAQGAVGLAIPLVNQVIAAHVGAK